MDVREEQSETPMYHTMTPYSAPSTSASGSVLPTVVYPEYPADWRNGSIDPVRQAEILQYQAYMGYPTSMSQGDILCTNSYYQRDLTLHPGLQSYPYTASSSSERMHSVQGYQSTSTPPSSSTSSTSGKPKRKRVQSASQRRAANIRERRRMFHLNEAFDTLRKRLPAFNYEKRLSRIETLRLAITYISFMQDISNGQDPNKVKLKTYKEFEQDFYANQHENISDESMDSDV